MTIPNIFAVTLNEPHSIYVNFALTANCSRQSNGEQTPGASHGVRWLKDLLLSKRTDHLFRMIIVGDPKIKLGEIGISSAVANNLLITEKVNSYNLD
jgi:RNA polymerase Rpb1, domain 2